MDLGVLGFQYSWVFFHFPLKKRVIRHLLVAFPTCKIRLISPHLQPRLTILPESHQIELVGVIGLT